MKSLTLEEKIKLNPRPQMIDDFWNDCISPTQKQSTAKKNYYQFSAQNSQNNNSNIGKNYQNKLTSKNKNTIKTINTKEKKNPKLNASAEKMLNNIYNRHPSLSSELKNKELKKLKSKDALIRCYGLYAYGLELQKASKINGEHNKTKKIENEVANCTFKPKTNKRKKIYGNEIVKRYNNNKIYQPAPKKNINKSFDDRYTYINNYNYNKNNYNDYKENYDNDNNDFSDDDDKNKLKNKRYHDKALEEEMKECTFKPYLNNYKLVKRLYNNQRNKFGSVANEKETAEFILRYTKARDEYMIKRFKKLSRKDDSYDNSFLALTTRLCNQQYRNYLNVNSSIPLFGETVNQTIPNINCINSSIGDFKGLSVCHSLPNNNHRKNNYKDDYVDELRKSLLDIDLNGNDD